jgi:hypothetical protein
LVELSFVVLVVRCVQFALNDRAILRPVGTRARDRVSCVHTGGCRSSCRGGRRRGGRSRGGSRSKCGSRSGRRRRAVSGSSEFHAAGARAVAWDVIPLPSSRAGAAVTFFDSVEISFVVVIVRCVQFALNDRAMLLPFGTRAIDWASCVHTRSFRDSGVNQEDQEENSK